MADTQYQAKPFIFASKGIVARYATDRMPPGSYINLQGCYERSEDAMSSRYGTRIINRDPDNVGDGVNYYFANPVNTISRLKYNAATWRYAGSGTELYRRTGDTQGMYTAIYGGLSALPFGSASTNCFASSQPYLFIADANLMLKDSGTGLPTQWGITPPNQPANVTEYGPHLLLVDDFTGSPGGYTTVNVSGWSPVSIGSVTAGTASAVNDFVQFGTVTGITVAFNGALATNTESVEGVIFNIYSTPNPPQFSAIGVTGALAVAPDTFTLVGIGGTVSANTTGSVGKTVALDLSQNNQVTDDDLIAIAMQLSDPAGISEIKVMFDVNNSGYTSSYYYKSISPAYYQSGITGDTDAYETASSEILALSLGLLTGTSVAQPPNGIVAQLQSSTANTGQDAWSTIYSRRGDFVPVGNAGENGFDWASVTGWQIEVTTTTESSVDFAVNGLYLQWGSGPSSFGGVGYDYRFIYFNANTQTPSNPSSEQFFSQQFGFVASYAAPIVLRQAFNVTGVYSSDPQVTHIRIYRRGGYLNENWYYVDQIPNVTAGGFFAYKDIIPDASLLQSDTLQLDNDPPITSSLQNPIVTTLTAMDTAPGTSPYDLFAPQTITVADADTFLPGQLVVIGTPQNLEQVRVVAGGVGTFTAVLRLTHAIGEQVQVFSIPQQPCDLVTLAYGQLWVAGDPNNPHFLYYSKPGYPENFSPANYIPVGSPSSPIMAVINFRGTLLVATLTTWYQISPGNPPYAQPTGSTHGLVSKTGWTHVESALQYQAIDGIREFRGSDGAYRSLPIEWVFQDVPLTPLPLLDRTQIGNVCAGFLNNTAYFGYQALDGQQYRLLWSTDYARWRNDDVPATAMYLEEDTNTLLFAKAVTGGYAICQDRFGDYDDGGWINGQLTKSPINMNLQAPYEDLGAPHFPKNWNTVEVDANTAGQDMTVILNFDEGIAPLTIGTINTTTRQKIQLEVNSGFGQESYKCSPEITASVFAAPFLYQMNVYAGVLAAARTSLDTYWIDFGTEASKICKQCYFDYTSTAPINIAIYADGSSSPYYTVTLPAAPNRSDIRVRFPALKFRKFRMIVLCNESMQMWRAPRCEWKAVTYGSSYALYEVGT